MLTTKKASRKKMTAYLRNKLQMKSKPKVTVLPSVLNEISNEPKEVKTPKKPLNWQ